MSEQKPGSGFGAWMGSMWLYTLLRFGVFAVLWVILVLLGLTGLIAAFLAAVLSVLVSAVLLAGPRARFAAQLEQRVNAARENRAKLDDELRGGDEPSDD